MAGEPALRPGRVRVSRAGGRLRAEAALARRGLGPVAGVDEAGRGACAGPLVVAACVLPERLPIALAGLDDSKRLTPATRDRLDAAIRACARDLAVVVIAAPDVDARGVHAANLAGMRRAVAALEGRPGYVLTDGFAVDGLGSAALGVVAGDAAIASIAAASVLAKVARDRLMVDLDRRHPGYGFPAHKGYGTAAHEEAIARLGACPEHRRSYANVRRAVAEHARRHG